MYLQISWSLEDCRSRILHDALPERFDPFWRVLLSTCIVESIQNHVIVFNEDKCRQLMFTRLLVFKLGNGKGFTGRNKSVTATDNSDIEITPRHIIQATLTHAALVSIITLDNDIITS